MKIVSTRDLCWASCILGQTYIHLEAAGGLPSGHIATLASALGSLERGCAEYGLPVTLAQVQRLKPTFCGNGGVKIPMEHLAQAVIEVHVRLIDELSSRLFLLVDNDKMDHHRAFTAEQPTDKKNIVEEDWNPVFLAFPSTKYDGAEAFKCYSVGRNTSCVFHLMRVLELGLTALGARFSVSLAHTNWAPAIEQIESKIRDMHKDPAWKALPDYKEQQEFYAQAVSHFGIFKDAWRNYTAHARGKYDNQEASDILNSTRAFMQRLAVRLHE